MSEHRLAWSCGALTVLVQNQFVAAQTISLLPDPDYVTFVSKVQKAKTRRGKDYFVLRVTIPKEVAEQANIDPNDYLLFKAKKAKWYHMIDWNTTSQAWQLLPEDVRIDVILAGLPNPSASIALGQATSSSQTMLTQVGSATDVSIPLTGNTVPSNPLITGK